MSYSTTLVNFAGGINSFQAVLPPDILTISKGDRIYINDSGDSMHGDLNMQGHTIKNAADPVDKKDVATKEYIDRIKNEFDLLLINLPNYLSKNDIDKDIIRYLNYNIILNKYKPKFWVSGFFFNGFEITKNSNKTEIFSESIIKCKHYTTLSVINGAIHFRKNDYIVGDFEFSNNFTFIGIVEKSTDGRVFSSLTGNKYFGFWKDKMNVAYQDKEISRIAAVSATTDRRIVVYKSNGNVKKLFNNNIKVIDSLVIQTHNWGRLVVGDTVFNEGAEFKLYECLGFNVCLEKDDINYIISIISII
jgi:hypothetical protein